MNLYTFYRFLFFIYYFLHFINFYVFISDELIDAKNLLLSLTIWIVFYILINLYFLLMCLLMCSTSLHAFFSVHSVTVNLHSIAITQCHSHSRWHFSQLPRFPTSMAALFYAHAGPTLWHGVDPRSTIVWRSAVVPRQATDTWLVFVS